MRGALGLTQEEVGRRARVSAKFLSAIENGHSSPSVDVFVRLVELGLAMPIARFFGGDNDEGSDEAIAVHAMLEGQPPAARRRAVRVLRALFDE